MLMAAHRRYNIMNGKKSRAIRKTTGADPKQVAYETQWHKKWLFNPDGSVFKRLSTTKRLADCGRSQYQRFKKAYKTNRAEV